MSSISASSFKALQALGLMMAVNAGDEAARGHQADS
jgi:hypothetical protein